MWKLAQWYRSIFEMPATDRPSNDIIEDDARLDKWFDQFMRDLARKAGRHAQQQRRGAPEDREHAISQSIFTPEEMQSHQR